MDISIEDGANSITEIMANGICPVCGGSLIPDGGCEFCRDCGYSTCGG